MAPFTSQQSKNKTLSVQSNVAGFLKRNAALIVGVWLFITFWMLIYTFMVYKPGYAAKSMVIIKDSAITGRYIEPDQYYALQTTSSSSSNPVLNTMGILKSNAIRNALWEFFKKKYPEQLKKNNIKSQQDWNDFFKDGSAFIKAKNQSGTDLIAIQFSWSDPLIAKEALGVVLVAFQNASRDLNRSEQITRTQFLDKQVADIEAQLKHIRNLKSAYQSKNGTVSVNREGDDLASSQMELSNKLNQIEAQAEGKEKLMRLYQQLLGMSPEKALKASAIGQNSSITRLQDELYQLEQQHSLLSASLTDINPKVREVKAQLEQVKANLKAEEMRTLGAGNTANNTQAVVADSTRGDLIRNMLTAQGEAQDLRAQAAVTRIRLKQIITDISGFPQKAEGLAQIVQKENSLSTALDQLRQKALEGRLKEEQTLSNVFIVDQPSLPDHAQFPNQSHLAILSVLMGLGVGLSSAFAKEQLASSDSYGLPQWLEPLDETSETNATEETPDLENEYHRKAVPVLVRHPLNPGMKPDRMAAANGHEYPSVPRMDTLTHHEPVSDKVTLPVVGSLFDSLVPMAGAMLHQQGQNLEFREDLTRPLVQKAENKPGTKDNHAATTHPLNALTPLESRHSQALEPALLNPDFEIQESHLRPYDDALVASPPSAIAQSVRVAPTPSPISVAQAQASYQANSALPMMGVEGVPVLHTAQVIPSEEDADFLSSFQMSGLSPVESANLDSNRPIAFEPIQYKAPSQINVVPEAPASQKLTVDTATTLYENQARQMPLPRRMRSMPAFLMGHNGETEEQRQPYTLIPKKQQLSPGDDLSQDMAPLTPPSLEAHDSQFLPFPDEVKGESFYPRQPLMSALKPGKEPSRHPEAYFGIQNRQQKQAQPPSSINRLMAAIQDQSKGSNP
jgi:uncharacterized protein involved in exopolysaccharide biosynthesis